MDLRSLEIKIARSENLPVLPQIASSVLKLADDPDASARSMERLIEQDSAITAKILRVANSSYYGLNQVSSIGRAISILGMNTIRSLVIGIAYQQIISGRQQSKCFSKLDFWRHSIASATTARIIGKLKMPVKAEELYGGAMMHDVGILVMDRFAPEDLDAAITHAKQQGMQLHQAEQLLYGFDHSTIGGMLADKWGLTGAMKNAIRFHHDPYEDNDTFQQTCVIAISNSIAHECGFTNNVTAPVEIDEDLLKAIDLPIEQLEAVRAVVRQEIERAEDALQIK